MIDIENAKKEFKKYTDNYDRNNGRIRVKIQHSYRVAENSLKISKSLRLNKEEQDLAELIGLLHDIGRFEQIKKYNTYSDANTIDHATLGTKILFEDRCIRKFVQCDKYDKIIRTAIDNHNKLKIQEGLTEKELLYCKIIRDADKLDIYNIVTTENIKDAVSFKTEDIASEILTEKIYNEFFKKETITYSNMKTNIDLMVAWIGYIYDINFKESFKMINEKQYISKIVNRIEFKDKETIERMKEIEKFANEYIEEKIKKDD